MSEQLEKYAMARFEKERDPMEIQEKLSLSAAETSKSDALSDPINPREEHAENDSRSSGGRNSDNKTSKRFRPYSTSSPLQASRSMLSEEKTMKSAPGYKVFVANLAFTTTEKMVESHMARGTCVLYPACRRVLAVYNVFIVAQYGFVCEMQTSIILF